MVDMDGGWDIMEMMITLLTGENSFEIERAIVEIIASSHGEFDGIVEKFDGSEIPLNKLPDILMGISLFANKRLVIIRGLSQNKSIWPLFGNWIDRISDDIHLVLVESKLDKRTSTYKTIAKLPSNKAVVHEFQVWSERDVFRAEKWVSEEAARLGLKIDRKAIQALVDRIGINQWQLNNAIEKLLLYGDSSVEAVNEIIDANPNENVFMLLETAINGDSKGVKRMLRNLKFSDDPFRLSALLFSQGFQLATVVFASKNDNVAKDFGIHPYVLSKLTKIAKKISKKDMSQIIHIFAEADDAMKISKTDPWTLIERALQKIANM